jgi:hypothetical protein
MLSRPTRVRRKLKDSGVPALQTRRKRKSEDELAKPREITKRDG